MRRACLAAVALFGLPAPAAAQVLVVGDSLEQGTGPHLQRELADLAVTVDARKGRPSGEGVEVLRARLRPEHEVVVFDLGTNDSPSQPESLAASLRAARELAGARCLVVASIQRPLLNGVTVDGLDGAVRDFVAETPTAQLVDWRAAARDPGVLAGDDIHATPDGYALRARLVAEAVRACLEPIPAPPPVAPPRAPSTPRADIRLPLPRLPVRSIEAILASPTRLLASAGRSVADALSPGTPEPVL